MPPGCPGRLSRRRGADRHVVGCRPMTLAEFLADPLRVTQISDSVLEIENRPVRRAVIPAAVILVAIAAGLAAIGDGATGTGIIVLAVVGLIGWLYMHELVQLTQLSLDRHAGLVRLRVTTLRGRQIGRASCGKECR